MKIDTTEIESQAASLFVGVQTYIMNQLANYDAYCKKLEDALKEKTKEVDSLKERIENLQDKCDLNDK